jgi:glyoxylase-like metal-dependent hydrolase (beta-lactamase superfamily II)
MKILNNITMIPSSVNCYLIIREEDCVLIDTGMPIQTKSIIKALKANCGDKPLAAIIITHAHFDHYGGLAKLVELYGAEVIAHKDESPYIMKTKEMPKRKGFTGTMLKFLVKISNVPAQNVDKIVSDQEIVHGLKVFHLPGHTPGTIALLDTDSNALFCGDIVNTDKDGSKILPPEEKFALDYDQTLKASIKMFELIKPSVILPGHGSPLFEPNDAIQIYLEEFRKV